MSATFHSVVLHTCTNEMPYPSLVNDDYVLNRCFVVPMLNRTTRTLGLNILVVFAIRSQAFVVPLKE